MQFEWEQKYTVAMQPNMLSPQAVTEIKEFLENNIGGIEWKYWDWSWNIEPGKGSKYVGKLPGRISTYLRDAYGSKLSTELQKSVGDIAKKHLPVSGHDTVILSFSKNVDWEAGKFGDGGSCFWGSRKDCRDNIRANNGFSVQAWAVDGKPLSRVWGALEEKGKLLVIYNAYGTLSISQFARALSEQFECDYRMVSLTAGGSREKIVYINNASGYVIGQTEDLDMLTGTGRYDLPWTVRVICYNCRKLEPITNWDGKPLCTRCYNAFVKECQQCGRRYWYSNLKLVRALYGSNEYLNLCHSCEIKRCPSCGGMSLPTVWLASTNVVIQKCSNCVNAGLELLGVRIREHI